jgi:hypothetical protein
MAAGQHLDRAKRLAQARADFNRRRRKCKLTFDQIRESLERGDSLARIAATAGVARSRMRIIYELWFRKSMRLSKGHVRREQQLKERRKVARESLKRLPPNDVVRFVAQQEGHQFIKPVPRDQRTRAGQVRVRELYVHGRLCGVHHLRNVRRQKGRRATYASTTISRGSVERQEFKIFYVETVYGTKRIDIRQERLLSLFKRAGQRNVTIYFPL